MNESDSRRRAELFCRNYGFQPEFDNLLGTGQEGFVWKTSRDTAIKVYDRIANFDREMACYRIIEEFALTELDGFAIPELLAADEENRVIELSIVSPPYILDFGKAYVHSKPDFDESAMEYYEQERSEWFGENWGLAQSVVASLEAYGIYYLDPRPSNIDCTGHADAV